jgi:hypothetical protein
MSYNPPQPPHQPQPQYPPTRPLHPPAPQQPPAGPHGQPPPQQPYGYSYPPPPQMVVTQRVVPTSGWATGSMVMGLLGLFGGWCLAGVPCVLAVIAGHVGLAQTKTGERAGRGQAVTGLIFGYLFVVPAVLIFFMVVVGSGTAPTPTPSGAR